jgi:hypothetical protein
LGSLRLAGKLANGIVNCAHSMRELPHATIIACFAIAQMRQVPNELGARA